MDRIAIAGLNLQDTDVAGLESLRRPEPEARNAFLRDLADTLGASELVFLATCNRVEVVWAREEGAPPADEDRDTLWGVLTEGDAPRAAAWRQLVGRDAIHHLFRVASSLDSLMLGEDQIIGQVREAYSCSADIGLVGPLLSPLFHNALQIGKKVRSETELARRPVSVVNLAVARLVEEAAARREDAPLQVAVVGAGEMGSLLVKALAEEGLAPSLVVNRSAERARALADGVGARAVGLDAFAAGEHPVDALVTATGSPVVLFDEVALHGLAERRPSRRPLLGVDLSVPRNLPAVSDECVEVVDLDALRAIADRNRALRAEAAADAEELVVRKLENFVRRFREEDAAPVVTELKQEAESILRRELDGLLGGRLSHLEEGDRRAIERWARTTFGRLLHPSVSAVKRMARERAGPQPDETPDGLDGPAGDTPAGEPRDLDKGDDAA